MLLVDHFNLGRGWSWCSYFVSNYYQPNVSLFSPSFL